MSGCGAISLSEGCALNSEPHTHVCVCVCVCVRACVPEYVRVCVYIVTLGYVRVVCK